MSILQLFASVDLALRLQNNILGFVMKILASFLEPIYIINLQLIRLLESPLFSTLFLQSQFSHIHTDITSNQNRFSLSTTLFFVIHVAQLVGFCKSLRRYS